MAAAPLVSVLLPVYNGGAFLAEAVAGVLAQTLKDWELVVIDDGSTDGSGAVLAGYAQSDRRVGVYGQDNCGVISSLNRGLGLAQGKYLARLDADDVWLPERLARGVALLEREPAVVMAGSAYFIIDEAGWEVRIDRPPLDPTAVDWQMLFHNSFCNSAVLVRGDVLRTHGLRYSPQAQHGEDYDLWSRVLEHGRGMNLSEPLVKYRRHGRQDSQTHALEQRATANRIAQRNLARLGLALDVDDVDVLRQWYHVLPSRLTGDDVRLCAKLFGLLDRFARRPGVSRPVIRRLRRSWFRRILRALPERGGLWWRLLPGMARMDAPGLVSALAWSWLGRGRPGAAARGW